MDLDLQSLAERGRKEEGKGRRDKRRTHPSPVSSIPLEQYATSFPGEKGREEGRE